MKRCTIFLGHPVYKISRLALIEVEKSLIENLIGEKGKWTIKGTMNDKQEGADCLLHNVIRHTQHLYQISKS